MPARAPPPRPRGRAATAGGSDPDEDEAREADRRRRVPGLRLREVGRRRARRRPRRGPGAPPPRRPRGRARPRARGRPRARARPRAPVARMPACAVAGACCASARRNDSTSSSPRSPPSRCARPELDARAERGRPSDGRSARARPGPPCVRVRAAAPRRRACRIATGSFGGAGTPGQRLLAEQEVAEPQRRVEARRVEAPRLLEHGAREVGAALDGVGLRDVEAGLRRAGVEREQALVALAGARVRAPVREVGRRAVEELGVDARRRRPRAGPRVGAGTVDDARSAGGSRRKSTSRASSARARRATPAASHGDEGAGRERARGRRRAPAADGGRRREGDAGPATASAERQARTAATVGSARNGFSASEATAVVASDRRAATAAIGRAGPSARVARTARGDARARAARGTRARPGSRPRPPRGARSSWAASGRRPAREEGLLRVADAEHLRRGSPPGRARRAGAPRRARPPPSRGRRARAASSPPGNRARVRRGSASTTQHAERPTTPRRRASGGARRPSSTTSDVAQVPITPAAMPVRLPRGEEAGRRGATGSQRARPQPPRGGGEARRAARARGARRARGPRRRGGRTGPRRAGRAARSTSVHAAAIAPASPTGPSARGAAVRRAHGAREEDRGARAPRTGRSAERGPAIGRAVGERGSRRGASRRGAARRNAPREGRTAPRIARTTPTNPRKAGARNRRQVSSLTAGPRAPSERTSAGHDEQRRDPRARDPCSPRSGGRVVGHVRPRGAPRRLPVRTRRGRARRRRGRRPRCRRSSRRCRRTSRARRSRRGSPTSAPPFAVPSSFVTKMPVTLTALWNCSAWRIAFWPFVASITSSVSCGASGIAFPTTRRIFSSSCIRFCLRVQAAGRVDHDVVGRARLRRRAPRRTRPPPGRRPCACFTISTPLRSLQIASCSTAAARKVSAAPSTTRLAARASGTS